MQDSTKLKIIKGTYWISVLIFILDFIQMIFPELAISVMQLDTESTPAFNFAIRLAASHNLGVSVLLIWGSRKPLERAAILPIILISQTINLFLGIIGINQGLMPASALLFQIIIIVLIIFFYSWSYFMARKMREEKKKAPEAQIKLNY